MISFNLKILAGRVGEKLKLRTKFKEDLRKIDEKWRGIMDAKEREQRKREKMIRAQGRGMENWMDERAKYEKPDWELFKERVLTFPPEERLMYLTRWRQIAEAEERKRNWIETIRKYQVSNILIPEKMTTAQLLTKPWYKEWHDGCAEDIVGTPRMTGQGVREAMGVKPDWYEENYFSKPIKEGDMEDLVNVYKVVRKTAVPYIFESALIGVRDGRNRIIYPLGQIVTDQLDGIGIFGYKKYADALSFKHWLENHELHLGQIVIMKAKGKVINADLREHPIIIGSIMIGTGIVDVNDESEFRDDNVVLCSELAIIEPALDSVSSIISAPWTGWEIPQPELQSEPTYCTGDTIVISGLEYMLAIVDFRKMGLINYKDGNRWSTPTEIKDVRKITLAEMNEHINQNSINEWHKKE